MCVKLFKKNEKKLFFKFEYHFEFKFVYSESITVVENDSIDSDDDEEANIFNKYFNNLVEDLNLHVPENLVYHYCKGADTFSLVILKYQNYPSGCHH